MSVLNQHTNIKNAGRKPNPKSIKPLNCPTCQKQMNICTEEKDLFYCQECLIHVKNGDIVTIDHDGEYQPPLGYVSARKTQLRVVKKEELLQDLDFYFNTGDKKCFRGVLPDKPKSEWMVLEVKYDEQANPHIDVYFRSGDKKIFRNIEEWTMLGGWMLMTKMDGNEITLNAANINWFSNDDKIYVNSVNVNWIEEV